MTQTTVFMTRIHLNDIKLDEIPFLKKAFGTEGIKDIEMIVSRLAKDSLQVFINTTSTNNQLEVQNDENSETMPSMDRIREILDTVIGRHWTPGEIVAIPSARSVIVALKSNIRPMATKVYPNDTYFV